MRTSRILSSMLQFFVAVGLMGIGSFFLVLSYLPFVRTFFINCLSQHPGFFSLGGLIILGMGVGLFLAFYAMNRGEYYQVKMEKSPLTSDFGINIDTEIIRTYAETYWKHKFPFQVACTEVIIHSGKEIELVTEVPALSSEEQKELLERANKELKVILAEKLGYQRDFLFTLMMK